MTAMRSPDSRRHSHLDANKDRLDYILKIFLISIHEVSYRFYLNLRLFIIMGVTWVMEAVSWAFKMEPALFYITDILNCLQGPIIFILFVCKRKNFKLILER